MAIYSGKDALLKIEYPAGSGVYVNAAYLTQTSINESTSPIVAGDLLQHTVAQFVTGDNAPLSATADASGYLASDTSHYFLQRLYESRQSFSVRIYKTSTLYFEAAAKLSSLSISGGYNDAAAVSLSMQLSGVVEQSGYNSLIASLGGIHHWPLNETSGSTAADIIGGADGTYTGTVTLNQSGFIGSDGAAEFDGSTGYVNLPTNGSITKSEFDSTFSIVAWVQPDDSGTTQRNLCQFATTTANKPFIMRSDQEGLFAGAKTYYMQMTAPTQVNEITTTSPHLQVLCFSSDYSAGTGSYTYYIDNEEITLQSGSTGNAVLNDLNIIGRYTYSGTGYFDGRISHFSIHDRELTAAEVAQIWAYRNF